MRFYVDEDLTTDVARVGRALGLDIVSVEEVGTNGLADPDQLDYAAREGSRLVTRDRDDFLRLAREFAAAGRPHGGTLIVPRSMVRASASRIAQAIVAYVSMRGDAPADYPCDFLRP